MAAVENSHVFGLLRLCNVKDASAADWSGQWLLELEFCLCRFWYNCFF